MTLPHTPILPKKINRSLLLSDRILYDKSISKVDSGVVFLNQIIHEDLSESTARNIVYSDFYSRFYDKKAHLPLFVALPSLHSGVFSNYMTSASSCEEKYSSLVNKLSYLGVNADIYHLYHNKTLPSLLQCDQELHAMHRLGLRSDVVYYNLETHKIVPDHRVSRHEVMKPLYTIKFFLNSTKDVLLGDMYYPYYLFGCVAILVNPSDKRYKKLGTKEVILPITNRQVPIIPYEGVSIEGHGTHILTPSHNRSDLKIAIELGLPIDVYAFDKYGKFTKEAKDFSNKSLNDFGHNVIKYIDDISNLEKKQSVLSYEYRDMLYGTKLFPILEKNLYIGLGYRTLEDKDFVASIIGHGETESLLTDIETDEFFCISNQDSTQPVMTSVGGYFSDDRELSDSTRITQNLVQQIVCDFFAFRLLDLSVKGDEIIDALSLSFDGKHIWEVFYDYYTKLTKQFFDEDNAIYNLLSTITSVEHGMNVEQIDILLTYIDENSFFLHTKKGYSMPLLYNYHYDNEYIGLATLLGNIDIDAKFSLFYRHDESKYIKYFVYLYHYIHKKPLSCELFAIDSSTHLTEQWDMIQKNIAPDVVRVFLLQDVMIEDSDEIKASFSLEEYDRFLHKWWNISRIIPVYGLTLSAFQNKILENFADLSDYDCYFITRIHELYDEVVFLQSKNHIPQMIHVLISTLRYEISDLLLYVLKTKKSSMSDMVASYLILFSHHLLYPLFPTTVLGFLKGSGYVLESNFFIQDSKPAIDKNYKCTLMMYILSQRYKYSNVSDNIKGFVLQANRDFIESFRLSIADFSDFLGTDCDIVLLEESDERPQGIDSHKIFTMQRGIIEGAQEIQKVLPSLSVLHGQLQYKQQLLQTMKNTIVRFRSNGQTEKIALFENQITTIVKEITDLEYQISKLKYF